ncbi:MAG: TRAP transporter substrate-binding protein [Lentisphaeria bacterium]|jgi:TRAP-type C4-dicarboxylate transport system substrate-binding protein|nr:TRAP transporter substrate-binding protein [Lentisphaeria bacterium]
MMVRTFALFAALALLVGCGKPQKAEANAQPSAPVVTLTYANFPPAATFPCVQMEHWREEVEAASDGQVKVRTFPGGQLLGAKNMLDGVIDGTADIGCFAMSYHPGRFPLSEAVDLPHFFPSATCASLVLHELIEKYQPKEFAEVEVLAVFTCPPGAIMTSQEIKTLADLQGLSLRVSGTAVEVAKRLGAVPVAMPQSDTPSAIQKGTVKGILSSMEVLKDMNYAAYCPYALKLDLGVVSFAVVMNRAKFQSLPPETQALLKSRARAQAEWTGQYVDGHVQAALAWSAQEKGHKLGSLSAEETAKVRELLQPLVDEYVQRITAAGLPGEEIIREIAVLKEKYADR